MSRCDNSAKVWFYSGLGKSDFKILKTAVAQEKCELLSYSFAYRYTSRAVTKFCSLFLDNTWGADIENMLLISKFNKVFWF